MNGPSTAVDWAFPPAVRLRSGLGDHNGVPRVDKSLNSA
jgi:hypothetical protein